MPDCHYFADKHLRFGMGLFFVEIRRNTTFEILRLSHVDERAVFVEVLIYAGVSRQGCQLFTDGSESDVVVG